MMNYTFPQLLNFAHNAGFQGQSANTISAIALAESGGNPDAYNGNFNTDPGGSFGVLQINAAAHGYNNAVASFDPQNAFNQAYTISNQGTNFNPWSTYKSGSYQQFMPSGSENGVALTDNSYNASGISPTQSGGPTGLSFANPGYGAAAGTSSSPTYSGYASSTPTAASYATAPSGSGMLSGLTSFLGGSNSGGLATPVQAGSSIPQQLRNDTAAQNQTAGNTASSWLGSLGDWFQRGGIMLFAILAAIAAIIWLGVEHGPSIKKALVK